MVVENGKFYFIKDNFFNIFKDYNLMANKENGNKRMRKYCWRSGIRRRSNKRTKEF